jgi:MSHA biogenesis protein MshE
MARPEKIRLGDMLVQQNLVTGEQLKLALEEQKRSGRKLGRVLVESGYVTEEGISTGLARQLGADFVDLKTFKPQPELIKLLPEAQARRQRALVLNERAGMLVVGMADPTDLTAFDELARILKREIDLAVVTESQLLSAIDRVYSRAAEISGLAKELTADMGDVSTEFGNILGLTAGAEDAPVVKLLNTVFEEALKMRASDIHIEPQEKSLLIRFRIDGVLHVQTEADAKISTALVLRLKLMSGLDISEKRLPQDGRFNIKLRNTAIDIRISSMPTQHGESVVMRLLAQNTGLLQLDKLHMPPRVLDRFRHAIARPSGIVLVTGPTGSGKTTTLYAALNELNTPEKKIITVEDPVEYRLPGLNQVQVHEKIDLSFSRVLRTAAPGSGHHSAGRNARPGNRRDRHACRHDRPPRAVHPAHQRCAVDADPAARHGCAALHGGDVDPDGAGPAPGARVLRKLFRTPYAGAARALVAQVGTRRPGGQCPVQAGPGLQSLRQHRLSGAPGRV